MELAMEHIEITVRGSLVGKRLDLALSAHSKISRRRAKAIIDKGSVFINGRRQRIASKALIFGDQVSFAMEPAAKKKPLKIDKHHILFHQNGVIAINKPSGLPTQASKKTDRLQVLPLLKSYFLHEGYDYPELTLVHRLDKETSGVLLLAENPDVASSLMQQFRDCSIRKTYHALCYGQANQDFEVQCKLTSINPQTGMVKVSQKSGKSSETVFTRAEYFKDKNVSLVHCFPKTGRSHQLRAHLAHVHNPILGDKVYGNINRRQSEVLSSLLAEHHYLHARLLEFRVPGVEGGKTVKVKAPYPETWQSILSELRNEA